MRDFEITPFILAYDNSVDAFIPELWAQESLSVLRENMVALALVHRDFSKEFARYGQVINTRRPGTFTAKRKSNDQDVTVQDATAEEIQVKMDQHLHVSFVIKDGEETLSFADLVATYLAPAVQALASAADKIILSQAPRFLANVVGGLGTLAADATCKNLLLDSRNVLNKKNVPLAGRNMVLTPDSETYMLGYDKFTDAEKIGDGGTAVREASLGRRFGWNLYMDQNMLAPQKSGASTTAGASDAAKVAGDTIIGIAADGDETIGHWCTIAGDAIPHRYVACTTDDVATIYPALAKDITNTAVITHYTQGAVNNELTTKASGADGTNAGYRSGWHGYIEFDGGIKVQVGQIITFGNTDSDATKAAATPIYTIIDVDSTSFMLDRPLDAAIANDDKINPGPCGSYNFGFRRDALAFVNRPLALPRAGTGAAAAIASADGLGVRVVMTYEGRGQGTLVTVDMLAGVKILDEKQGVVALG